ncbi:MAG: hypothetical protein ABGX83_09535, partial [Nitrospira sp.]
DFNIPMIWLSVNLDLFIVDSPPKLLYWKILLLSTFIFREDYRRRSKKSSENPGQNQKHIPDSEDGITGLRVWTYNLIFC